MKTLNNYILEKLNTNGYTNSVIFEKLNNNSDTNSVIFEKLNNNSDTNSVIFEKLKLADIKDTIKINNIKELNEHILNILINSKEEKIDLDLRYIDVSSLDAINNVFKFDTAKTQPLSKKIKTINVTGWDTSGFTDMFATFYGLSNLEKIIGIEDWDISNVKNMWAMFAYCPKLKLDLSKWDISILCSTNMITTQSPFIKIPCLGI